MSLQINDFLHRWENVICWLGVAFFCKAVLKWSAKDVITAVMKEVRDTASLNWTPAGINGTFILLMFISIMLFLGLPSFFRFFSVLNTVNSAISLDPNKAFMGLVIGGTMSLVCVLRAQ